MNYSDKQIVINKIKSDIEEIKEFDNTEHYIEANFRQFTTRGEYDDNSVDLSYHYNMLKMIENDENFFRKLNFVLYKYVK